MARLTWRNVDAPNFNDAIRARESGAGMFDAGIQRIQDTVQGIKDRRNKAASQDAMGQLLAISDRDQLDAAMAGGLESFGLKPGQASDAFMTALGNRGSTLLDQANTEQLMEVRGNRDARADRSLELDVARNDRQERQTNLDMQLARAAEGRAVAQEEDRNAKADLTQEQNEVAWARKQEQLAEEDAKLELETQAANELQQRRGQYTSIEEAKRDITSWNLDPVTEQAYLQKADALPESFFSTDEMDSARQEEVFRTLLQGGSTRRQGLENDTAGDTNLGIYNSGRETFGNMSGDDMGKAMIDSLRSDIAGDENAEGILNESAGDIQATYKRYRDDPQYKDVPDYMLAQVITNKFKRGGTALWGQWIGSDGIKFDDPGIKDTLDTLAKPGIEDTLSQRQAGLELREGDIEQYNSTVQSLMDQYEQFADRGDTARANAVLAEAARYSQEAGMNGIGMDPNDPSASLMRMNTMSPSNTLMRAARGRPESEPAAPTESDAPDEDLVTEMMTGATPPTQEQIRLRQRPTRSTGTEINFGGPASNGGSAGRRGNAGRNQGAPTQEPENEPLSLGQEVERGAGLAEGEGDRFVELAEMVRTNQTRRGRPLSPGRRQRYLDELQEMRTEADKPEVLDQILDRLVD